MYCLKPPMQKPPEGKLFINLYENLCLKYLLINIRNTVSDGVTRTLVLNIERAHHD